MVANKRAPTATGPKPTANSQRKPTSSHSQSHVTENDSERDREIALLKAKITALSQQKSLAAAKAATAAAEAAHNEGKIHAYSFLSLKY